MHMWWWWGGVKDNFQESGSLFAPLSQGSNLKSSDLAANASYHFNYLTGPNVIFLSSYIIYFIIIYMYQNQMSKSTDNDVSHFAYGHSPFCT